MQRGILKLVERSAGEGELVVTGGDARRVRYRLNRYQGMLEGSGVPIPGLHRIEGAVEVDGDLGALVGCDATLRLEDGRTVRITVADSTGRILAEGHGPGRGCSCC